MNFPVSIASTIEFGFHLQMVKTQDRICAVRCLLYLSLGLYQPGMTSTELVTRARRNVFFLLEMGIVGSVIELLGVELEQGRGMYEGSRGNITIADNLNLRGE